MSRLALVVAALVLVAPASAADAPDVRKRIVPGRSIGKVAIGMSLKQVKAVLGRPEAVIRREQRSFTRSWVEYSWDFTTWRVGFEVYRGVHTVVSIRSSARAERTKERIGYGSSPAQVKRAYGTDCDAAFVEKGEGVVASVGYICVIRGGFFLFTEFCGNVPTAGTCASRDRRWGVGEFAVLGPREKPPFRIYEAEFPPP